jgi:hypothetical protein
MFGVGMDLATDQDEEATQIGHDQFLLSHVDEIMSRGSRRRTPHRGPEQFPFPDSQARVSACPYGIRASIGEAYNLRRP